MNKVIRIGLGVLLAVLLGFSPASAEFYVAGYLGAAIPTDKDVDVNALGATPLLTLQDVSLDTSLAYGGKVGYFFESLPYFGLEIEGYGYNPDASAQTVQSSLLGVPGSARVNNADLSVAGLGINGVFRLQLDESPSFPKGRLQPYAGMGLGVYFASLKTNQPMLPGLPDLNVDDNDTNVGFQALLGLKYFLIEHLALFAEYKYVYTGDFEFEETVAGAPATVETSLTSSLIYGGIAWHF